MPEVYIVLYMYFSLSTFRVVFVMLYRDIVTLVIGSTVLTVGGAIALVGGGAFLLFISPVLLLFSPVLVPLAILAGEYSEIAHICGPVNFFLLLFLYMRVVITGQMSPAFLS